MKISIITVCFNSAMTLPDTIKSVLSQDFRDVEYIVVDGGSSDRTPDIVKSFGDRISKFVSEKDNGLYDALNKGISLATGEVIGILHSDDVFASNRVLSDVADLFDQGKCEGVYGDLQYVDRQDLDKVIRFWKSGPYTEGLFLKGWMPPHPAFFARADVYRRFGKFNTMFKSAADYEFMLRVIHKHKISICYLPDVLVKMRVGGKSNVSFSNRIRANREDRLAWKINGLQPAPFTFIRKPLSKILQFFRKG